MKGKGRLVVSGTLICRIPSQTNGRTKRKANRKADSLGLMPNIGAEGGGGAGEKQKGQNRAGGSRRLRQVLWRTARALPHPNPHAHISEELLGVWGWGGASGERCSVSTATKANARRDGRGEGPPFELAAATSHTSDADIGLTWRRWWPRPHVAVALASASHGGGVGLGFTWRWRWPRPRLLLAFGASV